MFVSGLQPPTPYTLITRTLFSILEKTSSGFRYFRQMDFSDSTVTGCSAKTYSGPECGLIAKYSINRLRCFQANVVSDFSIQFQIDFGETWFPPSIAGASIGVQGCSIDCMKCLFSAPPQSAPKCTLEGKLAESTGFLEAMNLMVNDIIGLSVMDFVSFTCPNLLSPPNCAPGTYSSDTCGCTCPPTHVASKTGCLPCPGINSTKPCSGNGQCLLDWYQVDTPMCCCNSGWSGPNCAIMS